MKEVGYKKGDVVRRIKEPYRSGSINIGIGTIGKVVYVDELSVRVDVDRDYIEHRWELEDIELVKGKENEKSA